MEYIVFGDTGGHFTQLYNGLIDIGMTQDYVLPKNTTIVHCGDLVHKGPASMEILHMIDEVKEKNPDQWVQIIGNHEAQYLGGIVFKHVGVLDEEGTGILETMGYRRVPEIHLYNPCHCSHHHRIGYI